MSELVNFLLDPQVRKRIMQDMLDSANRGMIASTLGAPVDIATNVVNLGIAGGGYAAHKAGLIDAPPSLIDPIDAVGSSEWIGEQMRKAEMVSANRNQMAELGFSVLSPVGYKGAQKAGKAVYQMEQNAASPRTMVNRSQRGVIQFPAGMTRSQKAEKIQGMAEEVATKLRQQGFNVELHHSGSAAGPSSYVSVFDPVTGRSIQNPLRISDHSKGAFNSQFVNDAQDQQSIDDFYNMALGLRSMGKSSGQAAIEQREIDIANKTRQKWLSIYDRASEKISNGESLSNKERQAMDWVKKNGL